MLSCGCRDSSAGLIQREAWPGAFLAPGYKDTLDSAAVEGHNASLEVLRRLYFS